MECGIPLVPVLTHAPLHCVLHTPVRVAVADTWRDWVLHLSAKDRNTVMRTCQLTKAEMDDLKKVTRRRKQTEAQHRYLVRQREKKRELFEHRDLGRQCEKVRDGIVQLVHWLSWRAPA